MEKQVNDLNVIAPTSSFVGFYQRLPRKRIIFAVTGLTCVFSLLSLADCSFMIGARFENDTTRVGLFSQMIFDLDGSRLGCVAYDSVGHESFDRLFRAGRTFGVITALLTCMAFLMVSATILWLPQKNKGLSDTLWTTLQYTLMVATVTQMFAFFALGSDFTCPLHDCQLTGVGVLACFNVIFLAGLSIVAYLEPPPTQPWLIKWDDLQSQLRNDTLTRINPQVSQFLSSQRQERTGNPAHYDNRNNIAAIRVAEQSEVELQTSNSVNIIGMNGHTTFRFILLTLFLISWSICLAGVEQCTFILVGPVGGEMSEFSGIGLFKRAIYIESEFVGCIEFPDVTKNEFDQVFLSSRVFAGVTAMLMTVVFLLSVLQLFVNVAKEEMWFVIRVLLPSAAIFQLLVFFVYRTETCVYNDQVECIPGSLGIWVILNVILMVCLSILILLIPPPPNPFFARYHHDEESLFHSTMRRRGNPGVVSHSDLTLKSGQHTRLFDDDERTAATELHYADESNSPTTWEEEPVELITVTVEYNGFEKKVVKTLTHPDGSRTITTTIEDISPDDATECSELEDNDLLLERNSARPYTTLLEADCIAPTEDDEESEVLI